LRLSRFHWHDLGSASLGLPLGSMVYWLTAEPQPGGNLRPKRLRSLGPYVRRSYQPFAFSPWSPIDCSTGQEPTATFWSSSGYRSCDRQIHTPLTSRRRRSFRSLSSYLPWHPTRRRITYSRYNTSTIKLVAALGFHLEPLPPSHCLPLRPWTLRRRCVLHLS